MMEALLETISHHVVILIELFAIIIIILGTVFSSFSAIRHRLRHGQWFGSFEDVRKNIGRTLLLALEFLLAAEIIRSIGVGETLEAVIILGLIVMIRSFLSIAIEMEIHGRWPWNRSYSRVSPPADS